MVKKSDMLENIIGKQTIEDAVVEICWKKFHCTIRQVAICEDRLTQDIVTYQMSMVKPDVYGNTKCLW